MYAKTLEAKATKPLNDRTSTNIPTPTNLYVTELDNELEVSWDPPDCDSIVSYLISNNGRVIGEGRVFSSALVRLLEASKTDLLR